MAQDAAAGGPNAQAIGTGLQGAGNSPLSIADLGGENVQALAGRLARTQGEPREIATQFLADRNAGMAPRLIQSIDQNLSGGNAFQAAGSLMAQRKADAGPLYQAAYAHDALNPDTIAAGGELDNMISRPSMQNAAHRAMSIAQEEGRDPTSLGITFNEAGDPKFEKVPSWQTLDYLKRGLDDVVNQSREPLTGRLVLDEAGNAVNSTRKTFLNFMDDNNPDYAAARLTEDRRRTDRNSLAADRVECGQQPRRGLSATAIATTLPIERRLQPLYAEREQRKPDLRQYQ
jgi:hypothetical protein